MVCGKGTVDAKNETLCVGGIESGLNGLLDLKTTLPSCLFKLTFICFRYQLYTKYPPNKFKVKTDPADGWTHVTAVIRGTATGEGVTVYHNGTQAGSDTKPSFTSGYSKFPGPLVTAGYRSETDVALDELVVWFTALAEEQVQELFQLFL